jgi:hypothetical protein
MAWSRKACCIEFDFLMISTNAGSDPFNMEVNPLERLEKIDVLKERVF